MKSGYLYCLYNKCFDVYGESVYKLGFTKDLVSRMRGYRTCYVTPSVYLHTSREFGNSRQAESILFHLLRSRRVIKNREFFKVDIEKIKVMIDKMSALSDEYLACIYKKVENNVCPDDILDLEEDILTRPDFDMFKFKPTNPDSYIKYGFNII